LLKKTKAFATEVTEVLLLATP